MDAFFSALRGAFEFFALIPFAVLGLILCAIALRLGTDYVRAAIARRIGK